MRLRSFTTLAIAATAMLAGFACAGDSPAEPKSNIAPHETPSQALLGGQLTATKIVPMLRTTPLTADIVVSKTIGVLGGTISLPGAGFTLVVPPLAVGKSTVFTITARKGSNLAYDMEPHGTTFLVPLVATQSLANTNVTGLANLQLSLGYYSDPTEITTVSELLGVQLDLLKLVAISTIPHFSGYIYATGRDME